MNYVLGGRTIGAVLARSQGTAGNGLLAGLVAYWGLDEASGNALDKHSGGLTLTANNAPGNAAGQVYATARTFNGSTQYFSRASEAATQTGDIDFALACWIYFSGGTYKGVMAASVTSDEWIIGNDNANWFFTVTPDGTTQTKATHGGAALTNQWVFLAAWHDSVSNLIAISINNGEPVTAAHSTGVYTGNNAIAIGRWPRVSRSFPGRIGPVAFWKNRTLSADDRAALWNGGAGLAYAGFS